MLYGEEIHVLDAAAEGGSPVAMNASVAAVYTRRMKQAGVVRAFGFDVTTGFSYDTQVAEGVLTLYRYPGGDSSNKVALATIKLSDAMAAKEIAIANVPNMVENTVPVPQAGPADYNMGDSLAVEVTTQATGGTYIAGAFQPFIHVHHRGEPYANQAQVTDQTAAITGSWGNVGQ
jgi:hypothetical protein